MTTQLTADDAAFFRDLFSYATAQPEERRCQVWWAGRKHGRHTPRNARDGAEIVPQNVCHRVFLSQYPATVCDECDAMIQRIADEDEAAAKAAATSKAFDAQDRATARSRWQR